MCKKLTFSVFVVSMLVMAGTAFPATVMQYSFDGASGSDIPSGLVDDTGTYTATIIAGSDADSAIKYAGPNPTYNTSGTSAEFSNTSWDNDAGDAFLVPDAGGIDFSSFDAFTVEFFIYPSSSGSGNTRRIFSEYIYAYMYLDSSNTLHAIRKWGGGSWDENRTHLTMANFPHDSWSHVAMTWDADAANDKFKLYINGKLAASDGGTSTATIDSIAGFTIGGYQRENGSTAQFFVGKIDEFRLSDVALDPNEFLGMVPSISFATASSEALESVTPALLTVTLSNPEEHQTYAVNYDVVGGTSTGGGVDYLVGTAGPACWDYTTQCHGDTDNSGDVKGSDFLALSDSWYKCYPDPDYNPCADFDRDGCVRGFDFLILKSNWYQTVEANCSATLQFGPGETSKPISIDIVNDGLDEEDETMIMTLSNPRGRGVILGKITEHTYTIVDPRPKVSFDTESSSGPEDVTWATIAVNLSHAGDGTITVEYAVTGGTATGSGVDYTLAAGTLQFDPGVLAQHVSIDIMDDEIEEYPNETIELTLSSPTNATLGLTTQHIFTILDNEVANTFTNSIGIEFVRIDPGTFTMGSYNGNYDEKPVHNVTISQPFYMGKYEVTNAQYEQFDPSHQFINHRGFLHQADEAVIFVSWEDVNDFCQWLSQLEGRPYRLPTEAEWEHACRAGTTTEYFTGDSLSGAYYNEQNQSATDDPEPVPLYVGTALPNPFGLYDMHGNVEEWCYDWHGPYEASHQIDPVGRAKGYFRVSRGGSHGTYVKFLRSANRLGTIPADKHWLIGFRVVMGALPATAPLPEVTQAYQIGVSQEIPPDINDGPDPNIPYFTKHKYVKILEGSNGPLFSQHNHVPGLVECPNGDLLAAWYTCNRETPREEHGIAVSRLRYGADEWDLASPFWDAPDRNDHTTTLWKDETGKIYHFQGLGAACWNTTATIYRTSTNNGVTWSEPYWVEREHTDYTFVESTIFRNSLGHILLSCDQGGGAKIRVSEDNGQTWYLRPGQLSGNHGVFAELSDGRLLGFSRKNGIDGKMPQQISYDMGMNWTVPIASEFREVSSGRRCAMLRLKEGPLFLATFGTLGSTYLIGAVSYDDGETWMKKLMTDCSGDPVETTDGNIFIMDCNTAEPKGYCAIWQGKNGLIHLITSRQHYAFNLKWLMSE